MSVGVAALVPVLFERAIRGRLEDLGFQDVDVTLDHLGLDRAVLHGHVDDIQLGTVVIEPGLRLLWAEPRRIRVPDARASAAALARAGKTLAGTPAQAPQKRAPANLDVSIVLRDPEAKWAASATGTIVLGDDVRLENGHLELAVARGKQSGLTVADVKVSAKAAGRLSPMELAGSGAIRAAHLEAGPLRASRAALPFTFDARGIAFARGSAEILGGTIETEPFSLRSSKLVLHARGLRLEDLVGTESRLQADGLVDGSLTLRVDRDGPDLHHGELHARTAGRLRVRDAAWRKRLARIDAPVNAGAVTAALLDFKYDRLAVEIGAPGGEHDVILSMTGRGATNKQPLDLVVRVNGAREAAGRWLGKVR